MESLQAVPAAHKLAGKIEGSFLLGAAEGSHYAGFIPTGMPCIYYHMNGEKVIGIIDRDEAVELYQSRELKSTDDAFSIKDLGKW